MKNPTILKDELGLLRADRSAVITELRKASESLKTIKKELVEEEAQLEVVLRNKTDESARLKEIQSRAFLLQEEVKNKTNEVKSLDAVRETARLRNSHEVKLHLGRIKELRDKEDEIKARVAELIETFDRNVNILNNNLSEKKAEYRDLDSKITQMDKALKEKTKELEEHIKESEKLTKARLKREDKIRVREKQLGAKEEALSKKEEDLLTMAKDITIVYGRLKELYAKVDPDVDLDRLILKAT